jgi:non-specific serine/threonine protein kinase
MLVLHVNWADGAFRLWGESLAGYAARESAAPAGSAHPFAAPAEALAGSLHAAGLVAPEALAEHGVLALKLPGDEHGPRASDRLRALAGQDGLNGSLCLRDVEVPALRLRNDHALAAVLGLEAHGPGDQVAFGHEVPFWIAVARFAVELLADQRFVPTVIHPPGARGGGLRAAWRPWLHDESARMRMEALLAAMPPVARSVRGEPDGAPWSLLCAVVDTLCDATARSALRHGGFIDAIRERDPRSDLQVAWLAGLLDREDAVPAGDGDAGPAQLLRDARAWLGRLEETGRASPFRLGFRLEEPPPRAIVGADDLGQTETWRLGFLIEFEGEPPVRVEADRVWAASPLAEVLDGRRIERPQEMLLAELGRACRIYPALEAALAESHPSGLDLTTAQAAQFLREYRELLEESDFAVVAPDWWDRGAGRLGVRLVIEAPPEPDAPSAALGGGAAGPARLGLDSLVRFRWQPAVGDQPLSADQLRLLMSAAAPLVRIGGRWVEYPSADLAALAEMLRRQEAGPVTLREAMRLARGAEAGGGVAVLGMDASGWVARVLGAGEPSGIEPIEQPEDFRGALRPYQKSGLSWLWFLERYGFGACLADDMGLGKTIQLIALLLHERRQQAGVGPTLLVVPTSLIENWARELKRFAPALRCHVHHGPQRLDGEAFTAAIAASDVVITTYALVPRDRAAVGAVEWWRVVLDEAQFIKNPPTQQAGAIRALRTPRRVALTGTPVENRLSELWSIMDFCNPGYLGSAEEFRRTCAVPIERHRDAARCDELRRLVRPFILRRLKSDPSVISDLPACVETREFATLTTEQATMYQAVVDDLLAVVDGLEGIERRGRVLGALTRLKQICNHPAQVPPPPGAPAAPPGETGGSALSGRSGKCRRLIEMLEEILATGAKVLLFTQYRRMGDLLGAMIRQDLDCQVQFMHGGTPRAKRQEMIDLFQRPDGGVPVFILSLRTGGIGLNLTAASHVFHVDRWWNPAVEDQATDRAFRIGQTRTVHVHKFVCVGTLEERIDEMIEQKTELARNIIGSGEQWLTELSTQRLAEILRLRSEAMEAEA